MTDRPIEHPMCPSLTVYAARLTGSDRGRWRSAVTSAYKVTPKWWRDDGKYRGLADELRFQGQALIRYVASIDMQLDLSELNAKTLAEWIGRYTPTADGCHLALRHRLDAVLQRAGHELPDLESWHHLEDPVVEVWRNLAREQEGDGDPPGSVDGANMDAALRYAVDAILAMTGE